MKLKNIKSVGEFVGVNASWSFFFSIICSIALFLAELAMAYGLQLLLVATGLTPSRYIRIPWGLETADHWTVFIALVTIGSIRGILAGLNNYLKTSFFENFIKVQRTAILDWSFLISGASGSRASTLLTTHVIGAGSTITALQNAAVNITSSLLIICFLLRISIPLTLVLFIALGVAILPLQVLQRKVSQIGKKEGRRSSGIMVHFHQSIKNLLLLQIFGQASSERKTIQANLQQTVKNRQWYQFLASGSIVYTQILGITLLSSIALFKTHEKGLSSAIIISYLYLLFRLFQILPNLAQSLANAQFEKHHIQVLYQWWCENISQIQEASSLEEEDILSQKNSILEPLHSPLGWQVKNVTFSYPHTKKNIFSNLSLNVAPGKAFVMTGPSGSGKSTLLGLFLGQLKPQSGSVSVTMDSEKHEVNLVRSRLLSNIGYVGPESYIIEGTLRENLLYAFSDPIKPTEAQIEEALESAECSFVQTLKGGLEYQMNFHGSGLSAGQKQRLSLARALLRRPHALILDEATSNLDTKTEEKLLQTFEKLKGKVTLIIATHRPALLRLADTYIELSELAERQI